MEAAHYAFSTIPSLTCCITEQEDVQPGALQPMRLLLKPGNLKKKELNERFAFFLRRMQCSSPPSRGSRALLSAIEELLPALPALRFIAEMPGVLTNCRSSAAQCSHARRGSGAF